MYNPLRPFFPRRLGNEALIPMSGSIGPRFSFTHYPRGGDANGPGMTLLRPIPDISAPSVTFLGMSPLEGGGAGLAFGTLGPVLGEVGTTTARVLVEVMHTPTPTAHQNVLHNGWRGSFDSRSDRNSTFVLYR